MFNFYANVESIRVDLMERSLDSFYLAFKKHGTVLSQKVMAVAEHLNFQGLP